LQYGCTLARKQPGDQHDLAVGKLQRVVMRKPPLHVDLTETSQALAHESELQTWHQPIKGMFVLDFRFKRELGAGSMHTATSGSPIAAKPRVPERLNPVDISLSPTTAGRDTTW
jgi:hypothetical protein